MPDTAIEKKSLGNRLFKEERWSESLDAYDDALNLDPTLKAAWFNKGLCHKKLGNFNDAITAFLHAVQIDAAYEKALANLADCYFKTEDFQQAYVFAERSLKIKKTVKMAFLRERAYDYVGAKLFFGIVDLKLKADGTLKLLEFGRGMASGFKGLEFITGQDINSIFREALSDYTDRPLIINGFPGQISKSMGCDELENFVRDSPVPGEEILDPSKLSNYAAIYAAAESASTPAHVFSMDNLTHLRMACEEKILFHRLFDESMLDCRPTTAIYPKRYSEELVNSIQEKFKSKRVVIKTPDLQRGNGVIVVNNNPIQLPFVIAMLIGSDSDIREATRVGFDLAKNKGAQAVQNFLLWSSGIQQKCNNWRNASSPLFLVESYEPSQAVEHNHSIYDPVMRVAFIISRDEGRVEAKPFASYWKLPQQPCGMGDVNEQSISQVTDNGSNVEKVSPEDQHRVFQQLRAILPRLFINASRVDLSEIIQVYQNSHDEHERDYATHLRTMRGNNYASHSAFIQAKHDLIQAKNNSPSSYRPYHELGIFYYNKGEHKKSLAEYAKALSIEEQPATFFRRGRTFAAMKRYNDAWNDFIKAKTISRIPGFNRRVDAEMARLMMR